MRYRFRRVPDDRYQRESTTVLDAVRAGDEATFVALAERYRQALHVHCYRMLGSFDEAEDLVQETLLRAWRARGSFAGRATFRTWLYRIATNACLNALERGPRRIMPPDVSAPVLATFDVADARAQPSWAPELPWLQPYPDHRLEPVAPDQQDPETLVVSRETIELTFLVALQHLPARQRAVLLLRDALDWSAKEVAELLDVSVASINSAHQRARATMRAQRPTYTANAPVRPSSEQERVVLGQFVDAWERADAAALTRLLHDDVRWAMPPAPLWFLGRATMARVFALYPLSQQGDLRSVATGANRQPAAAMYIRPPGAPVYHFAGINVLRVANGQVVEVTTFGPALCRGFDLPATQAP